MDIIRAWKDIDYRNSLSEAALPANPAGELALTEEDLGAVVGGVMMARGSGPSCGCP
jgi:mersacidin/lichenicidin family type 2 lantibiotic